MVLGRSGTAASVVDVVILGLEQTRARIVPDSGLLPAGLRSHTVLMPCLRLGAEYGSWPLWETEGSDIATNVDPYSLPIPRSLADELVAWGETHEATLDEDYPPDSGFRTEQAAEAWLRAGSDLATRLRLALQEQGYRVEYTYPSGAASALVGKS